MYPQCDPFAPEVIVPVTGADPSVPSVMAARTLPRYGQRDPDHPVLLGYCRTVVSNPCSSVSSLDTAREKIDDYPSGSGRPLPLDPVRAGDHRIICELRPGHAACGGREEHRHRPTGGARVGFVANAGMAVGMKTLEMNPILATILENGEFPGPDGQPIKIRAQISRRQGEFLQRIVSELKPKTTLEVGLAYGVSAMYICDALDKASDVRHIVIDSHQLTDVWNQGAGLNNLKQAGYQGMVEFIDAESQRALPRLEASGRKIDFAFIDGAHTFDHVLVDFFYIDRMLRKGGIIAFDDTGWPPIRKACRFIIKNRNYSVYDVLKRLEPETHSLKRRLLNGTVRFLGRHSDAIRGVVRPNVLEPDAPLEIAGRCVALRKEDDDTRGYRLDTIGHQDF